MFWLLDTYYLTQEKRFRGLYNDVAAVSKNPRQVTAFDMSIEEYAEGEYSFRVVFSSKTIKTLYLFVIIALTVLYVALKIIN